MADKDAHSDLKKRARRRLVGAVALTLLAVIVLPMVMDQEPQAPNQDIQVRIPSRDTPFEARLAPPADSAVKAGAADGSGEAARPPSPPAEPVEPETPQKAQPSKAATEDARAVPGEPAGKPDMPAPSAAAKKEAGGEAARAEALLNASEEFVVQLGVFADPGNVAKVRAQVKAQGYNSFTQTLRTPSGTKTRVRAGPFASREAAESARDKLRKAGLDGIVAAKTSS
jgi:DedD protein